MKLKYAVFSLIGLASLALAQSIAFVKDCLCSAADWLIGFSPVMASVDVIKDFNPKSIFQTRRMGLL